MLYAYAVLSERRFPSAYYKYYALFARQLRCCHSTHFSSMLDLFNVTAPFFALILLGYLAARYRLLPENAVPALNTFVLYFALPCMLFRFAARTPFAELFNLPIFLAYALIGLALFGLVVGVSRYAVGESLHDAAYDALAAAWSNWGYMGLALLPALLGQKVLSTIVTAGMADLVVLVSAAIALAALGTRSASTESKSMPQVLRQSLGRVFKNPLLWAILLGGVFSAGSIQLPAMISAVTRMLGDAAGPVALFTIGVSLYGPTIRVLRRGAFAISIAKLLIHPLLAGLIAAYVFNLGTEATRVLILTAALPVGGTVFLFAERAGANAERIAAAILVSTAAAFVTFTALCWALGVRHV
jgi:malonate transporter and related proteins